MGRDATHMQVGRVGRPHGVRGEIKLRMHNEASDALDGASSLVLETKAGAERLVVESVRGMRQDRIVALRGVSSREGAEALRGATVWVERSTLPALAEDEYYLVDLVGCAVVCGDEAVGTVSAVRPDPSVDTMVIDRPDGRTVEQPIVDAFLDDVDTAAKVVRLASLEGLVD